MLYAKGACPPSLEIEGTIEFSEKLPSFQRMLLTYIRKKITTVVLFSRLRFYLEKEVVNSYGVREDKNFQHFVVGSSTPIEDQLDEKIESMRTFIKELRQQDIRVLLVEPIPEGLAHSESKNSFTYIQPTYAAITKE